ncbi:GSCOCG00004499001-RA-CDS, partial [Cotesia congregata]
GTLASGLSLEIDLLSPDLSKFIWTDSVAITAPLYSFFLFELPATAPAGTLAVLSSLEEFLQAVSEPVPPRIGPSSWF